jgi:hypothetical protein
LLRWNAYGERMSQTEDAAPDVLPFWASRLLALLWILLFGGRWILGNLLVWGGFLTMTQVAALDGSVGAPCYALLLGVTCIALALRAVRRARPVASPAADSGAVGADSETPSAPQAPSLSQPSARRIEGHD